MKPFELIHRDNLVAVALLEDGDSAGQQAVARSLWSLLSGDQPHAVDLIYKKSGQPLLVASSTQSKQADVSFSHDNGQMLAAVSLIGPVGVDLERIIPAFNWNEIVDTWFATDEKLWWLAQPLELRSEAACQLWTRKEAIAKCLGEGIRWIEQKVSTLMASDTGIVTLDLCVPKPLKGALALTTAPSPGLR